MRTEGSNRTPLLDKVDAIHVKKGDLIWFASQAKPYVVASVEVLYSSDIDPRVRFTFVTPNGIDLQSTYFTDDVVERVNQLGLDWMNGKSRVAPLVKPTNKFEKGLPFQAVAASDLLLGDQLYKSGTGEILPVVGIDNPTTGDGHVKVRVETPYETFFYFPETILNVLCNPEDLATTEQIEADALEDDDVLVGDQEGRCWVYDVDLDIIEGHVVLTTEFGEMILHPSDLMTRMKRD